MFTCMRSRVVGTGVVAQRRLRCTGAIPWHSSVRPARGVRATLRGSDDLRRTWPFGQRFSHAATHALRVGAGAVPHGAHRGLAGSHARGRGAWTAQALRACTVSASAPHLRSSITGTEAMWAAGGDANGGMPSLSFRGQASMGLGPPDQADDNYLETEFPFGVKNKPTGVKYNGNVGTWTSYITIAKEYVHLGASRRRPQPATPAHHPSVHVPRRGSGAVHAC